MNETHLTGLEGTNPLGFLAALGVQVAFASSPKQPKLWWSEDITPHAIVNGDFTIDQIADQALAVFPEWRKSPALNPKRLDGIDMPKGDELKLSPEDLRVYLGQVGQSGSAGALMAALVAEGSLDKQGIAKPSDFYFTAGSMKFLGIARQVLGEVLREDLISGLMGPWLYQSQLSSLMWDVSDDRIYALRANNPQEEKKRTNPGPESLAILGLSLYPVFGSSDRTRTQGCSGNWKSGFYSWPLWCKPASVHAVKSLLAHAYHHPDAGSRDRWYRAWGVSRILRSPIRRSGQGGYGTFGPPGEVIWHQGGTHKEGSQRDGWKQLIESMDRLGAEASANGLTNAKLEALLADES